MWIQPQHKVRDPIWTVGTRWCKFSDTLCSTRDRTDLTFFIHWRSNTPAGRLLRCVVGWAQYCAGTSDPKLENVHSKLGVRGRRRRHGKQIPGGPGSRTSRRLDGTTHRSFSGISRGNQNCKICLRHSLPSHSDAVTKIHPTEEKI